MTTVYVAKVHMTSVHVAMVHMTTVHVANVHMTSVHVAKVHMTSVHVAKVHMTSVHVAKVTIRHAAKFRMRSQSGEILESMRQKSTRWDSRRRKQGVHAAKVQFSSDQFKMVSMRSEKPTCASPRLSEVPPPLPLKRLESPHDETQGGGIRKSTRQKSAWWESTRRNLRVQRQRSTWWESTRRNLRVQRQKSTWWESTRRNLRVQRQKSTWWESTRRNQGVYAAKVHMMRVNVAKSWSLCSQESRKREVWPTENFLPCSSSNNNNVHLSCAHQRPERSHDTY